MKKLLILFMAALFLSGCNTRITEPDDYGAGDDYKIYYEILKMNYPGSDSLIVLNDSTFGENYGDPGIQGIGEEIPGISIETINNYIFQNATSMGLKKIPGIKNLIFHSKYDGKQKDIVNVWFSRVGYDNKKSQAMVTMGRSTGNRDGRGLLIILNKVGMHWSIIKMQETWIA